ncbi:Uncharacterised protein [Legionella beliardensis]|uniref:Uncharacterized protein n=1 Tax=Legionella beliardensis TaxID=91822 RepID=A0A378JTT5_9GAMM|nr:hypothetical protein [Legionella beliardensis]STX55680.1 Uncharacterised protein [Legionella beliardensis]
MLDRDDDDVLHAPQLPMSLVNPIESDFHETLQHLKSVVMLLKGLYGQLNEEREIITLASGQMAHSVKQFEQYLKQFELFEKSCKHAIVERVKTELKQSIQENAQTIASQVRDMTYEPISHSINALCQLSSDLSNHRAHLDRSRFWGAGLFFAAALLGGVVSGLTLHYLTAPSQEIKVKLAAGEALMRSWSKLTKAEREKIFPSKS